MGRISLKSRKKRSVTPMAPRLRRGGLYPFLAKHRLKITSGFLVAVCIFAGAFTVYMNFKSGAVSRTVDLAYAKFVGETRRQGLVVQEILVDGRVYTEKDQILSALNIHQGDPILSVDLDVAQGQLLALPWIADAQVERRLPGTIAIHLMERNPLAIWQNKGALFVIDDIGAVILDQDPRQFSNLLVVVGADAPKDAKSLVDAISVSPDFQTRVSSAVRVGGRRWDLHLQNELIVKLPEKDPELAIQKLLEMQGVNKILDMDYAAIDMRLTDRMYLVPKDAGVADGTKPGAST